MEPGFPPTRFWGWANEDVHWIHSCMPVLILFAGACGIATAREAPSKQFADGWGRALIVLASVCLWGVYAVTVKRPGAAAELCAAYAGVALLVGFVSMQVCDFRWRRLTLATTAAAYECFWIGCVRVLFISLGAMAFGVLPIMVMPSPSSVRPIHQCRHNMKLLGEATKAFVADNQGDWLNPSRNQRRVLGEGSVDLSWRVTLLPYLSHQELRDAYEDSATWNDSKNLPVAQTRVWRLTCASSRRITDEHSRYFTSYAMVTGSDTIAPGARNIREADIRDGLANTAMFVEAVGQNIVWTEPRDIAVDVQSAGVNLGGRHKTDSPGWMSSYHESGHAMMGMADGSVRSVNERIDPQVLKALTTIAGGEQPPTQW